MKILYTAFKGAHNASFQLVSQFRGSTLFLTNSFQGLEWDLSSIRESFDIAIMFGVDGSLKNKVRIETCAVRDNDCVVSEFNIEELARRCRDQQIDCSVSCKPSAYLCNAAYYLMLKKIPKTVFIHIPSIKYMNSDFMSRLMFLEYYGFMEE